MAAEYRMSLARKCVEFERVVIGFPVTPAHVQIAIECLQEVPIPTIGKFPNPTDEDKQYYKSHIKPNWGDMLQQAIKRCQAVTLVNTV